MNPARIDLIDFDAFRQALAQAGEPLPVFRDAIKRSREQLAELFWRGISVTELVSARARFVDQILSAAWHRAFNNNHELALVAVGGYGRGELHPASDIDILILLRPQAQERNAEAIERYVTLLWDLGLDVGHSVRTVEQCIDVAKRDITIATNLMESRLVAGPAELFDTLREAISPQHLWPSRQFFESKWQEQKQRHLKFHDTAYNLEPNIKEGPGGLRDIQMISWVTQRHFAAGSLHDLVAQGFLNETEYQTLMEGQEFLWRIRFALHIVSGRREDRLLFEHQRTIAEKFGYKDESPLTAASDKRFSRAADGHRLGVELFMKQYFRTVMELSRLNEMLLQLYQEAILYAQESGEPVAINRRFQSRKGFVEIIDDDIFVRYPFALLEIFLVLQQNQDLKGVRAATIRAIRQHRYLIDDKFRADLRCRSIFMEILRQPHGITHELRRMNTYGILARYIPAFGAIVGQMQFDLFHVYTVDQHTLFVVRNLRRISVPEFAHELPLCSNIAKQIPKPELLYLAGIFHDIAKGRGGDHSTLGAADAFAFCKLHLLSDHDANLVAWLVENHLSMSATAQHKDIGDPEIVNQFASKVGDRVRLDYLYLLTIADMRGTNPAIWNSWKHSLLIEFYKQTQRALKRGLENPMDKHALIRDCQHTARRLLEKEKIDAAFIEHLWQTMQDDYFLRYTPEQIAWHTLGMHTKKSAEPACCVILMQPTSTSGGTDIFVHASQQHPLFAIITATLDRLGLNIMEARIVPSKDRYSMDTYTVLEYDAKPIHDKSRLREIEQQLYAQLQSGVLPALLHRKDGGRRIEQFSVPTQVSFSDDETNHRTVMEVITTDRPGLLSRIARVLTECGIQLQNAKISTFGAQAEDVFFITDDQGAPVKGAATRDRIRQSICELLDVQSKKTATKK